MMGLLVIFAGIIYLLVSLYVVRLAVRKAKRRGIAGWKWGVPAALFMYLLVFWDHIPTLVARQYYCGREAGFTVYKTLEQWKQENPGVAETLTYKKGTSLEHVGNNYTLHLNERFDSHLGSKRVFLSITRVENQIIDIAEGEVLARYIDIRSGWGSMAIGADAPREFKFWLVSRSCESTRKSRILFNKFRNKAKKIMEDK